MSDFQKCPECNKALDMVCVCTPDNYYVQLPVTDHVSKKALREWCEDKIKAVEHGMAIGLNEYECRTYILAIRRVLIDFCKEGE